jgi:hypothetical protein
MLQPKAGDLIKYQHDGRIYYDFIISDLGGGRMSYVSYSIEYQKACGYNIHYDQACIVEIFGCWYGQTDRKLNRIIIHQYFNNMKSEKYPMHKIQKLIKKIQSGG